MVTALDVKPGKTAWPGVVTDQLHDTGKQQTVSMRKGDAPRQKDLSFNCPASYHVPGPAEANRAHVLRGGGGVGWRWRRLAQCLGLGLRDL